MSIAIRGKNGCVPARLEVSTLRDKERMQTPVSLEFKYLSSKITSSINLAKLF
jgi:hypothetical protein